MKVRVIGCHGGVAPGYQTTCYFLNDEVLIDCGSACSSLTPKEQACITDIFITHPHLDHIKDICFILENTFHPEKPSLNLRSTEAILNDIHKHLLNNVLWPDFSKIYLDEKRSKPAAKFIPLNGPVTVSNLSFSAFSVNHPGHAVGYLVEEGDQQVIFTGDSGPCPPIWKVANECKNLKAIFTEVSFPSRLDGLARAAGHFTLEQLLADLKQLKHSHVPIYISHFKPPYLDELLEEFHRLNPGSLHLMHQNDVIDLG